MDTTVRTKQGLIEGFSEGKILIPGCALCRAACR